MSIERSVDNTLRIDALPSLYLRAMRSGFSSLLWTLALVGCAAGPNAARRERAPSSPLPLAAKALPLPGAEGAVTLDYLAVDRAAGRVWVPAGRTASVDVIDAATDAIIRIAGFAIRDATIFGKPTQVGPSAVTLGEGWVYVGNRGDGSVCTIDPRTNTVAACLAFTSTVDLASTPDGLAFVAATREVWATVGAPPLGEAPPERAIVILDAASPPELKRKARVPIEGEAEGYAVDEAHGLFFTNLADRNRTVAIDVHTRSAVATFSPGCGGGGPRGLAVDSARRQLFVACTNGVVVLDAQSGRILARAETGEGVDNIDYLESRHLLYVAAARPEKLSVFTVAGDGALTRFAEAHTGRGVRVVVADARGRAYVADSVGARILAFEVP
jgi:YVTN family beta-propeller protein